MTNRNEYFKSYNKEKMVRISLNLSKTKDKDIIQAIAQDNKQASLKRLIRRGIKVTQEDPSLR